MADFLSTFTRERCDDVRQSVQRHLLLLLNTRRGSIQHLPQYGLPEYNPKQRVQQEKKQFIKELLLVIKRYEPRIISLDIEEVEIQPLNCVLQVKLMAKMIDDVLFSMDAMVLSGGKVLVFGQQDA